MKYLILITLFMIGCGSIDYPVVIAGKRHSTSGDHCVYEFCGYIFSRSGEVFAPCSAWAVGDTLN